MRALSPILDRAIFSIEQERQAESASYVLFIDDTICLTVDGANYEVWVDGSLTRHGERGPIEINSAELKEIYLHLDGFEEPIQIKERAFYVSNHRAYQRLENAVDLYLLNQGLVSKNWEQEDV